MKVRIDLARGSGDIVEVTHRIDRRVIEEFIAAHGVDVNDVPLPSEIDIEDGIVTFEVVVRERGTRRLVLEDDGTDIKRELVRTPQQLPWPI